jgi:hypothetical protein
MFSHRYNMLPGALLQLLMDGKLHDFIFSFQLHDAFAIDPEKICSNELFFFVSLLMFTVHVKYFATG